MNENQNQENITNMETNQNPTVAPIVEPVENSQSISDNQMMESIPVEKKKPIQKKRGIIKTIFNLLTILLFLFIIVEAAIGVINMQKIRNDEKPIWCMSTKKTETELKTVTECHLGLYKIIKVDTEKKSTTSLIPFFLNE